MCSIAKMSAITSYENLSEYERVIERFWNTVPYVSREVRCIVALRGLSKSKQYDRFAEEWVPYGMERDMSICVCSRDDIPCNYMINTKNKNVVSLCPKCEAYVHVNPLKGSYNVGYQLGEQVTTKWLEENSLDTKNQRSLNGVRIQMKEQLNKDAMDICYDTRCAFVQGYDNAVNNCLVNHVRIISNHEYRNGYSDGYEDGHEDGHEDGYEDGHEDGYEDEEAYLDGYEHGYEDGYEDGDEDAYSEGYDDGYEDASDDIMDKSLDAVEGDKEEDPKHVPNDTDDDDDDPDYVPSDTDDDDDDDDPDYVPSDTDEDDEDDDDNEDFDI